MEDALTRMTRAKTRIEQKKEQLSKAQGMLEKVLENLKMLSGTSDPNEAERRLSNLQKKIDDKEAELYELMDQIETLMEEVDAR